ncbi:uncharacterized protein LOC123542413 [Mercenaria mercenaria]|uniref:uncharacterized protein LOC123542413 n=1 Tax=Mercenaria mercenaria TaxID=6596 RepID=UPI00234EC4E9|nr:uncharacterized protein LOC123542413 [Mercenaria mercenaria]XP_045184208.2 uncharacterized protein LOC123542413 [Mercenaria mercenaria]
MTHMMFRNPFLSDSFGPDYESPMSRGFNLNGAVLHNSPRLFSRGGSSLPRWLNFKTAKNGTSQNLKAEAHVSTKVETVETQVKETVETQVKKIPSYVRSNSNRSSKSSTSSNNLQRKVEEQQLKTKTEEWKKQRTYESVRKRRHLRTKQMNWKLRIVRRFYVPSVFCLLMGTVGIFCSTVRSLGEGTMFWTYKEQFRIIGLIVTVAGVLFLLITVGVESQIAQKMKKKGIREADPFIHPDFLKEPSHIERQISKQSSSCSFDI